MKAIQAIKLAGGAFIVLASLNAYAQASDAGADMQPAPTAKTMKSADRALQKSVRRALSKAKGVSVSDISVHARDGAVILEGSVPDQPQSDRATQVTQGVSGVTSVKNDLTLRPVGQ
jgi:osmotically-inducible protein OsmY